MKNLIQETAKSDLAARAEYSISLVQPQVRSKIVLDVGCGFGWFIQRILASRPRKIYGIEVSEADLMGAKKELSKYKNVSLLVGSAIDIQVKDRSADLVVSWEVIEQIQKGTEAIFFTEVARVLKKNGRFFLSTPYDCFLTTWLDPEWWIAGHRHYKVETLIALGMNTGFKVNNFTIKGNIWSNLGLLNMYISKWILRRRPFFLEWFVRKDKESYSLPNGYSTIFMEFVKL